ncbi:piggyBac transposable element-derived protein 4 [Caerostris darwini]|uniref:PiggyBac transposable element-derived protein 4 n=1 Tax=Caerostris darwini TaxID=1538125 RepID=A0AAV4Q8L7_9ARAC|nr:piggyBac transposable element-derived protein 4 [Caerostris darwini]
MELICCHRKNGGKNTQLEFRLDLIDRVIEKYHSGLNFHRGRPGSVPNPLRLTERHFLEIIAPTDKKLRPARQCAVCCSKRNENGKRIRKETCYFCPDCDVGLCITPCFKLYYTQKDF